MVEQAPAPQVGQPVEVHKTEWINNSLNPVWKPFQVAMHKLCNGDPDLDTYIGP